MKGEAVVEAFACKFAEVGNGGWGVSVEEFNEHVTLGGLDCGFRHRAERIRDQASVLNPSVNPSINPSVNPDS